MQELADQEGPQGLQSHPSGLLFSSLRSPVRHSHLWSCPSYTSCLSRAFKRSHSPSCRMSVVEGNEAGPSLGLRLYAGQRGFLRFPSVAPFQSMTGDLERERAQVLASTGMGRNRLFIPAPTCADPQTVSSSPSHTGAPACTRPDLDVDLWPSHRGCSLELWRAPCTASSESSLSKPRTRVYVCVHVCVHMGVSPELPPPPH